MSSASTLALFGRLVVSLAVVIGLMWGASLLLKRRGVGGIGANPRRGGVNGMQVELVARKSMGRNVSIAIVKVADQALVVGITDHQVTTLGSADFAAVEIIEPEAQRTALPSGTNTSTENGAPAPTWKAMLEQLREKTVRH